MNMSMLFAVFAIGRALQGTTDLPKVQQQSPRTLTATAAARPVRVDGVLDEADWKLAPVADGFVQSEPNTGAPASERTEVRVLYDANTLYIGAYDAGFHVYDISGELRGDLRSQGREIASVNTADMTGFAKNAAFTWGVVVNPKDGLAYVNDYNNGLWVIKIEPKLKKIVP